MTSITQESPRTQHTLPFSDLPMHEPHLPARLGQNCVQQPAQSKGLVNMCWLIKLSITKSYGKEKAKTASKRQPWQYFWGVHKILQGGACCQYPNPAAPSLSIKERSPWNWTKVDGGPSSAMHLCPVWHKDPMLSWIREIGTDRCWVNSPGSASGMMWKQATQETPHKQGVMCWPRQPAPSTPAREGTGDASGPQPERQQSGLTVKGMLKIWEAWF